MCVLVAEGGERPFQAKKAALARERTWRPERTGEVLYCWRAECKAGREWWEVKFVASWDWILLKLVCHAKNLNFILRAMGNQRGISNVRLNH